MVNVDSAKSKQEFKRLSKSMDNKLDKKKGQSVSSTPLPVTLSVSKFSCRVIERLATGLDWTELD
jgi:hypothetical protein